MKAGTFGWLMNFWPPFVGAGIRIRRVSDDFRVVEAALKCLPFRANRNYLGTHFGGSIYALTDPFYLLILSKNLGPDYVVWDKAAEIRFLKPGRGTLTARFEMTADDIAAIKAAADTQYKTEPRKTVQVLDAEGDIVAEVDRILYVRHKDNKPRHK